MLRFALIILSCAVLATAPALAQQSPRDMPTREEVGQLTLDELFDKLAEAGESRGGKAIEIEIIERFNESGSDTADLLMSWAVKAIDDKQYPLALDVLDQVVVLKPDFAEAWNKRATVHFLRDDYANSLADIRETLALEPRHFGALSGLGLILQETGRKEEALDVYRQALAIDPLLEKVRESVERLEKETEGNSI
jgi:tetratricopeptide (TPR) repeat protein